MFEGSMNFRRTGNSLICCALLVISIASLPALSLPEGKTAAIVPPGETITPVPIEKPQYDERGVPSTWKFLNEQEWIVDSIGRDIAEILNFAKQKKTDRAFSFHAKTVNLKLNRYSYRLTSGNLTEPAECEFTLVNFAWAPDNYTPFAKSLMQSLELGAENQSNCPDDFAKKLATADMKVILEENDRVSRALTRNPLDAGLHEQAALLQSVIGLLDFAGGFSDTRVPLSRICAHLAIAKVLNHDELNTIGTLADIALECLACRDGVAAEKATTLLNSTKDPTINSWLRAIKIRATGDYKIFDSNNHTELELMQFGLRSASNPTQPNIKYVKEHFQIIPARWVRILSLGTLYRETTRMLGNQMLYAEAKDFLSDYNFAKKSNETNFNSVMKELNLMPTRCLQEKGEITALEAISWDDVAAYHCRHILWATLTDLYIYEVIWSNKYQATDFILRAHRQISSLTLWPFVLRRSRLGRRIQAEYFGRSQQVFLHHPELVTNSNWLHTNARAAAEVPNAKIVPAEKFFNPSMPFGTAYFYADRFNLANCAQTLDGLEELHHWAPGDAKLCHDYAIKKYGAKPSAAQWTEAYGALADFNLEAMTEIARANAASPDDCIRSYERLAALNPAALFELAEYCYMLGKTDEAIRVAEEGVTKCQDPFVTSNNTTWLIRYYLNNGMRDKARELLARNYPYHAKSAFLQASAFCEHEGKLDPAEGALQIAKKRYGENAALCAFFMRNRTKGEKFNTEAKQLLRNYYPDGMTTVKVSDFKGNPQRGVMITSDDWMEPHSPLRKNCVIVALNGVPVEDKEQLALLTELTEKDSAAVIFWDGHKFNETEKKFGFSKDLNLHYKNFWGTRSLPTRKFGGQELTTGDRSLAAITPESFGANRCGILGIRYSKDRCLTQVTRGMPSAEAGLKVGDKIISVDKVPVENMTDREISNKIRGYIGTLVTMTISRDGRESSFIMKRKHPISDEDLNRTE